MSPEQAADKMEPEPGVDAETAEERRLIHCIRITREATIEECAQIAAARATRFRAKAEAQTSPNKQSYFAQSIEARVIADSILGLLNPMGTVEERT